MNIKMTPAEIQKEWEYRRQERLGLSAGANKPFPEHFAQAKKEADEWKAQYEKQTREQRSRNDL